MAAPRETLVLADRIHTLAQNSDAAGGGVRGGEGFSVPSPTRSPTIAASPLRPLAASETSEPDALLIRDGTVAAVGSRRELEARAPGAEILDLRGATITPGLTDAHLHLLDWALARREVDLAGCASAEAAAEAVARHASAASPPRRVAASGKGGEWVRGRGWNPHTWGGFPTRELLDRLIPDRPVLLQSHDMHAVWVNTRALERAGITAATPDPEGGRIVRDAAGRPTGVLLENAVPLVERCLPALSETDLEMAALEGQRELHRLGITGIHSFPGVHAGTLDPLRVLESLRSRGRLRLRTLQHIPLPLLDDAIRLGLRSGFGGDWIRIGGVKMFLDGALGSRTAWLRAPYEGTTDTGVQLLPAADFCDAVRCAASAGLASTVHAIGDAAVALALDVLADPGIRVAALPHRIEHVQLCPPERFGDAGRAGIVCSVQPAHLITDWRAAERHWGRHRSRGAFAFRSLLEGREVEHSPRRPIAASPRPGAGKGAVLAFGSDAPVEPVDPRLGLYAATQRQDLGGAPDAGWFPQERLGILEAIEGYTLGPAVAAGLAGRQGRLTQGAFADLVAWDRDPLASEGEALLSLRCLATVVGGELVWREGA